jgi:hypothetical protein
VLGTRLTQEVYAGSGGLALSRGAGSETLRDGLSAPWTGGSGRGNYQVALTGAPGAQGPDPARTAAMTLSSSAPNGSVVFSCAATRIPSGWRFEVIQAVSADNLGPDSYVRRVYSSSPTPGEQPLTAVALRGLTARAQRYLDEFAAGAPIGVESASPN